MAVERRAQSVWEGNLVQGRGRVTLESGLGGDLPMTWNSRAESPGSDTSPEELIAGAHASCFCMQLSHELTEGGYPPARLAADATCTFQKGAGITKIHLDVQGDVPDIDPQTFEKYAEEAKKTCPVSQALKDNVEISVTARMGGQA